MNSIFPPGGDSLYALIRLKVITLCFCSILSTNACSAENDESLIETIRSSELRSGRPANTVFMLHSFVEDATCTDVLSSLNEAGPVDAQPGRNPDFVGDAILHTKYNMLWHESEYQYVNRIDGIIVEEEIRPVQLTDHIESLNFQFVRTLGYLSSRAFHRLFVVATQKDYLSESIITEEQFLSITGLESANRVRIEGRSERISDGSPIRSELRKLSEEGKGYKNTKYSGSAGLFIEVLSRLDKFYLLVMSADYNNESLDIFLLKLEDLKELELTLSCQFRANYYLQ